MIAFRVLAAVVGFGLGLANAHPARAQVIVPTTILMSADLQTVCTAAQGAPVAFGTMTSSQASGRTATGSVAVTCDAGIAFAVGLDYGMHPSGGGSTRNMACVGSGDLMTYELYAESETPGVASTNPIVPIQLNVSTTGSSSANTPGGVGVAAQAVNVPVYGKILAANPAPCPGGYSDSVAITVGY